MPLKLKVQVTQADIDDGEVAKCQRCPVALATQRALRSSFLRTDLARDFRALTWGYRFYEYGPKHNWPLIVSGFIMQFDWNRFNARPFEFEIEIPYGV